MKKRKSNTSEVIDLPLGGSDSSVESARTSSASMVSDSTDARLSSELIADATDAVDTADVNETVLDAGEELDVMGTPEPLAASTLHLTAARQISFTPSTPTMSARSSLAGDAEESTFRRLNFTTKECQTPGRYDARHKLGQPLAVFCRVKPILNAEAADGEDASSPRDGVMTVESESSLHCVAPRDSATYRHGEHSSRFTFTRVFGPASSQEEVYTHAAAPLVKALHEGQNGLIFAYGITASGKTYSMQGTKEAPGIIPRIVADLFGRVMADCTDEQDGVPGAPRFTVKASYLEIYNESIYDLLVDAKSRAGAGGAAGSKRAGGAGAGAATIPGVCKLQSSKSDEVSVVNLREVTITDHREAFALLHQGQANRTMHETALNADSSRSHSVFTLKLVAPGGAVWSRLSVVDLAGSERTNRVGTNTGAGAGAAGAGGSRMRETVNINQSLLVLGRCLEALKYNQNAPKKPKVVPYRESQITRLFKDSLSGWGRTVMLTNASQNPADYDETIHALKYAAVAKEIRVVPKVDSIRVARSTAMTGASGVKRAPAQPLLELDELEHATLAGASAARRSSWDADDGVNPAYDALLDECFRLKQQVVELELAASAAEVTVREELTTQHEEMLSEMEEAFMDRFETEQRKAEDKYKKLFALWKAEQQTAMAAATQASTATGITDAAGLIVLRRELAASQQQSLDLESSLHAREALLESTKEMHREAAAAAAAQTKRAKQLEKELATAVAEKEQAELLLAERQREDEVRGEHSDAAVREVTEALTAKTAEAEQLRQELAELRTSFATQIASSESASSAAAETLASVQAEHKLTLKESKKAHDAELKDLKKAHKEEMAALKKSVKEDTRAAKELAEEEVQAKITEVRAEAEASAEEVKQLKQKAEEHEKALAQAEAQRAEAIEANARVEAELRAEIASMQASMQKMQRASTSASTSQSELESLLASTQAQLAAEVASKEAELKELRDAHLKEAKDAKKASDADAKESKKSRDAEMKELKKTHKEEMKAAAVEHEAAMAALRGEFEAQLAEATAVAGAIAPTPASEPLSDTWGQILSPIKSQPVAEAPAPAGRGGRKATSKSTTGTTTAAGKRVASKSKSSAPAPQHQQQNDSFDPFAFDTSLVLPAAADAFLDDEDDDLSELKKKLGGGRARGSSDAKRVVLVDHDESGHATGGDEEDEEEEYQPEPAKKRRTTTRTAVASKKAAAAAADKENAAAAANTGRVVRSKRIAAAAASK